MQLFHRCFGKKGDQPLIILHGLFGISDNWVTFGKQMAREGFEVFIPDQRNHGRSEWSEDFNYLALTNDLYDFIDAEEIENPVLLGHSMGGKVVMKFAVSYPDLVQKLLVVDIAPRLYTTKQQHLDIIRAMQHLKPGQLKTRSEAEAYLALIIKDRRIRQFILKNLKRNNNGTLSWRINVEVIQRNLDQMFDTLPEAAKFSKPVLFIKGGLSNYILPEDDESIFHHFPQARIVTIPNASHWVHVDTPEIFYQLTYAFLSDNFSMFEDIKKGMEHDGSR